MARIQVVYQQPEPRQQPGLLLFSRNVMKRLRAKGHKNKASKIKTRP
ncbi:hypothetical protein [Dethiosulfatarculus sandiegensis]|nr:hypothetical protein [Dethiosulfatarculus sandiegensis]